MGFAERKGLLADSLYGHTVRKDPDPVQCHASTRAQRFIHARSVLRLNSDDPYIGIQVLHVDGNARNQPAAANRHEDRIQVAPGLPQYLNTDSTLTCDDIRVVERMHEDQTALPRERQGTL